MESIDFAELSANLSDHFAHVERQGEGLVVRREGREPLVILPLGAWEGMRETLHLMSSPANAARLLASIRSFEAGEAEEHALIEAPAAPTPG